MATGVHNTISRVLVLLVTLMSFVIGEKIEFSYFLDKKTTICFLEQIGEGS